MLSLRAKLGHKRWLTGPLATARAARPAQVTEPLAVGSLQAAMQEYYRGNLRVVSLGMTVLLTALLPTTLFPLDRASCGVLLMAMLCAGVAYLVNRRGAVTSAAVTLVMGTVLAIASAILAVAYHQGGLDISNLRLFGLFALPILLCALVLPRRSILAVAGITSTLTLLVLLVVPRTPLLAAYFAHRYPDVVGSAYDIFAIPVILQWALALICYRASTGLTVALRRALRADALEQAQQQIAAQNEQIQQHNQQLEHGIARIQAAYAAVMRGDWSARVQASDQVMLPLTVSFNRLLDRSAHLMAVAEEYRRLRGVLASIEVAILSRQSNLRMPFPRHTSTAIDGVLELVYELGKTHELRPKAPVQAPGQHAVGSPSQPQGVVRETQPMRAQWPSLQPLEDPLARNGGPPTVKRPPR